MAVGHRDGRRLGSGKQREGRSAGRVGHGILQEPRQGTAQPAGQDHGRGFPRRRARRHPGRSAPLPAGPGLRDGIPAWATSRGSRDSHADETGARDPQAAAGRNRGLLLRRIARHRVGMRQSPCRRPAADQRRDHGTIRCRRPPGATLASPERRGMGAGEARLHPRSQAEGSLARGDCAVGGIRSDRPYPHPRTEPQDRRIRTTQPALHSLRHSGRAIHGERGP